MAESVGASMARGGGRGRTAKDAQRRERRARGLGRGHRSCCGERSVISITYDDVRCYVCDAMRRAREGATLSFAPDSTPLLPPPLPSPPRMSGAWDDEPAPPAAQVSARHGPTDSTTTAAGRQAASERGGGAGWIDGL